MTQAHKTIPQPSNSKTSRSHQPAVPDASLTANLNEISQLLQQKTLFRSTSVLALQRTIGNHATQQILKKAAPKPKKITIASEDRQIRRKIGFEFEDSKWRPYIQAPLVPIRPANRKEVLHAGSHFNLEGDDTDPDPNKRNIEFVTDPFDITKGGLTDLKQAMTEIRAIMKRLSNYIGDENTQRLNNNYVQPAQHGLSNNQTRFIGGHKTGTFKMQATQGVSLEDLPTLMETFGTNVPGETAKQRKERKGARKMAYGNETGTSVSDFIGILPTLARQAVTHIANNRATYGYSIPEQSYFEGSQDRLVGFFSQIIMYVKGLTIPDGKYMKYKIPLLGRIQFDALFAQLDAHQRNVLARNNAQAFIGAILTAANAQAVLPKPSHMGGFWDTAFAQASPLLRGASELVPDPMRPGLRMKRGVMQSLTIGDWLQGITTNVDHLSPTAMDAWLQVHEAGLSLAERNERTGMLESFNTLTNQVDDADRAGTSKLNILENRAIAPTTGPNGTMTPVEMEKAALNYFKFMFAIKTKAGNPGKFPT